MAWAEFELRRLVSSSGYQLGDRIHCKDSALAVLEALEYSFRCSAPRSPHRLDGAK